MADMARPVGIRPGRRDKDSSDLLSVHLWTVSASEEPDLIGSGRRCVR
jgi:hypothetical protein